MAKENNRAIEIDKLVAQALHSDASLIFDDDYRLMATSLVKLQECKNTGGFGIDSGLRDKPISFCVLIPQYSTDIKAAWPLTQQFGKYFNILYSKNSIIPLWNITCEKHPKVIYADVINKAICKIIQTQHRDYTGSR